MIPTDAVTQTPTPPDQLVEHIPTLTIDEFLTQLVQSCVKFAIHLAVAIIVFYLGRFVIRRIYHIVGAILIRRRVEPSLTTFILSTIKMILYFILVITVIGILGIETSSFLALFASAGVAIGMALSGTLQNFAGGVLILLLKPYKVGDYIEAQGYAGTVAEIQIFHTLITTPDNKAIIIPNGGLSTSSINNWSARSQRRVAWDVAISYGDDVEAARKAILELFASDSRILTGSISSPIYDINNPITKENKKTKRRWYHLFHRNKRIDNAIAAHISSKGKKTNLIQSIDFTPTVLVTELANSCVKLSARAWVNTPDYWPVYYKFNELIYSQLPSKAGVSFPFPQLDVHFSGTEPHA